MNSQDQFSIILTLLAITTIVVIVLAIVVIRQNEKIKFLTTPRYGFMGKPLAIAAAFLFTAGTFGVLYLGPRDETPVSVSVSDSDVLQVEIEYDVINKDQNMYFFSATPLVNDIPWGGNDYLSFTIEWEINKNGTVVNRSEFGLSQSVYGGIVEYLRVGENVITARVSTQGRVSEAEVTIVIQ